MKNVLLPLFLLFIPGIAAAAAPIHMRVEVTLDKDAYLSPSCTQATISVSSSEPIFKLGGQGFFDKDSFYHVVSLKVFNCSSLHAIIGLTEYCTEGLLFPPKHLYKSELQDWGLKQLIDIINDTLRSTMGSDKTVWANINHELVFDLYDVQPESPWFSVLERTLCGVRNNCGAKIRKTGTPAPMTW